MGAICSRRDEPLADEYAEQHDSYSQLWVEILGKLNDDAAFSSESSGVYRQECTQRKLTQLSKCHWQEICAPFVKRISCDDQRTKQRIYDAVEELYPGPPDRLVGEASFVEFNRLALTLAERDLRDRLNKMKQKAADLETISSKPSGLCWRFPADDNSYSLSLEPQPANQFMSLSLFSSSSLMRPDFSLPDLTKSDLSDLRRFLQPWQMPEETQPSPRLDLSPKPLTSVDDLQELKIQQAEQEERLQKLLMQAHLKKGFQAYDIRSPSSTISGSVNEGKGRVPSFEGIAVSSNSNQSSSPAKSTASMSVKADPLSPASRSSVAELRRQLQVSGLQVRVFNKKREMEDKRLFISIPSSRISLLRLDGGCEDSWAIKSLRSISLGLAALLLPDAPTTSTTLAIRFRVKNEDRYLCVAFETVELCHQGATAISELCEVPVSKH